LLTNILISKAKVQVFAHKVLVAPYRNLVKQLFRVQHGVTLLSLKKKCFFPFFPK